MLVFAQMPQRVVVLASAVLFSCWLASMTFMLIVLGTCDSLKTCIPLHDIYKISKSHKRRFLQIMFFPQMNSNSYTESMTTPVTIIDDNTCYNTCNGSRKIYLKCITYCIYFLYDLVDHKRQLSLSICPSS